MVQRHLQGGPGAAVLPPRHMRPYTGFGLANQSPCCNAASPSRAVPVRGSQASATAVEARWAAGSLGQPLRGAGDAWSPPHRTVASHPPAADVAGQQAQGPNSGFATWHKGIHSRAAGRVEGQARHEATVRAEQPRHAELQESMAEEVLLEGQVAQKRSLALLQASHIAALERQVQDLLQRQGGLRDGSAGHGGNTAATGLSGPMACESRLSESGVSSPVQHPASAIIAGGGARRSGCIGATTGSACAKAAAGEAVDAEVARGGMVSEQDEQQFSVDLGASAEAESDAEDGASSGSGKALSLEEATAQLGRWKELWRQVQCLEWELSSRSAEVETLAAQLSMYQPYHAIHPHHITHTTCAAR